MLTPEEQAELEALRAKAASAAPQGDPLGRNLARFGLQGLSFGFGDELAAVGGAGVAKMFGDERPFTDIYRDIHSMEAQGMNQFREQHPGLAMGSEAAGALVTAPFAAAKGLQLASRAAPQAMSRFMPRAAAPVLAGGVEGAVYGTGSADPGQRLQGAGIGAALGGTIGGAAGVAQKALRKPLGWLWRQMSETPASDATRVTMQALEAAGYTADDVRRAMDELGPDARLANLGGELGALGDVAASSPGGAKYVAQLEKQHRNQIREVMSAFESAGKMRPGRRATRTSLKEVAEEARREVKPIYQNLYGAGVRMTPELDKMLRFPAMRPIYRRAKYLSELDDVLNRREAPKFDLTWDQMQNRTNPPVRIEHIDYLQRALREAAGDAKGTANRSKGTAFRDLRRAMLDEVDPDFPEFQRARSIWSGRRRIEEAAKLGQRGDTLKAQQFDAFIEDAPRVEREAFLMGVHDYIRDKLGRIRRGRDLGLTFDTPEFERRMSLMLGPKAAQELTKKLDVVRRKAVTYGRTRNSATFPRQAAERKLRDEQGGSQFVSDLMTGNVIGAGTRALRDVFSRESLDPMMLDELARLTLDTQAWRGLNLGQLPGSMAAQAGHMVRGPATAAAVGHTLHNAARDRRGF